MNDLLVLSGVSVSFGERTVLRDCTLRLAPGDRVALMGPSGCGKTTLLRTALRLTVPDRGTVSCSAKKTAAAFQEPRLLPWLTALQNVNFVLSDRADTLPLAASWLEKLELSDARDLYPGELSGGMQQRVSLARALATAPDFLVLDEPLRGLDAALRSRVIETVASALPGASLLLSTHDEEAAAALGCRILRYRDGRFE